MVRSHPSRPPSTIYKALLGGSTGGTALCTGAAGATCRRGAGLRSSKACAAAVAAARRAVAPSRVAWARAATVAAPLEPAKRAVRRSCNLRFLWLKGGRWRGSSIDDLYSHHFWYVMYSCSWQILPYNDLSVYHSQRLVSGTLVRQVTGRSAKA